MAKTFSEYLADFGNQELFGFDSSSGQIIPQTSSIKDAIKSLLNNIFNQSLNLEDETPAGRLCEALTIAFSRFCSITAAYSNQVNPYYATGQMLDAIGSLFGVVRAGAIPTVINIVAFGRYGTYIPKGSLIEDENGNQFTIVQGFTIGAGGEASTTATCTKVGIISVTTGVSCRIISAVSGWSEARITGITQVGKDVETDEHYRSRITKSRWTGSAFVDAISAEIKRIPDVESVLVVENGSGDTQYLTSDKTIVNSEPATGKYITLLPHSVCIIVYGANLTDESLQEVASAIYETKSAGCDYTSLSSDVQGVQKGTEIVRTVSDKTSGNIYKVLFNTPNVVQFSCNVSVGRGSFLGTDEQLIQKVKDALNAWTLGEAPFVDGLSVGQSIFAFEAGAAISSVIPAIQVKNVTLTINGSEVSSYESGFYEIGKINLDDTVVTIS